MTKEEALKLLRRSRSVEWNAFRKRKPQWVPDLSGLDLSSVDLVGDGKEPFDLSRAILCGTKFSASLYYLQFSGKAVNISGTIIDSDTIFPGAFNPIKHGAQFMTKYEISKDSTVSPLSIFVSYAWANEDVVLAIDQWLRLKGLSVRIDRRDFFAGSRIRDEIIRLMADSNVVVIFYSKESKDKPWPEFERELASDLEMNAKQEGIKPPRILYVVIDDTLLHGIIEKNRLAIFAKGKRFELVCEEIYHHVLQLPRKPSDIDLNKWKDFVF